MHRSKIRGMKLLAATSANNNRMVMGIDQDPESPTVGDTVYAVVNHRGYIVRRADAGEFLHVAAKNDDVGRYHFEHITSLSFPSWCCLAYEERELSTVLWLYRKDRGQFPHQYGILTNHVGPQGSGVPLTGKGRVLMHRVPMDLEMDDFDYTMECLPGYSIDTVVEALPSFNPMSYDEWLQQLSASQALPYEWQATRIGDSPTVHAVPPIQYKGNAHRWHQAVEEVAGMQIRRPWPLIELTVERYEHVCRSIGIGKEEEKE